MMARDILVLEQMDGEIHGIFRALANGFQKLDKIKDPNRQSKQLEELTGKMRECMRLINEFDREIKDQESRNPPEFNKQLNEKKQSMIKELNSYMSLSNMDTSTLGNKRVELFDGVGISDPVAEDNIQMASDNTVLGRYMGLSQICQTFIEKACLQEETSNFATQEMQSLIERVETMLKDLGANKVTSVSTSKTPQEESIKDPQYATTKGSGIEGRLKRRREINDGKQIRCCQSCGLEGHDRRNCPALNRSRIAQSTQSIRRFW